MSAPDSANNPSATANSGCAASAGSGLPCPFCGKAPAVTSRGYNQNWKWVDWVGVGCGVLDGGCGAHQNATTEAEAWARWNRRPLEKRLAVALHHILLVTAAPPKYGRYITNDDREIIKDALIARHVPNARVEQRRPAPWRPRMLSWAPRGTPLAPTNCWPCLSRHDFSVVNAL